jgi:hypothetical protein
MSSGPASWIAPDLKAVLDRLTDVQILALTLFGEARSEPIEGIVGVGCVIRNRVTAGLDWWGEGYRGVCLAPYEFSMCVGSQVRTAPIQTTTRCCRWRSASPTRNRPARCSQSVCGQRPAFFDTVIGDRVKGSTHYHSVTLQPRPACARMHAPAVQVGRHLFYAGVLWPKQRDNE